MSRAATPLLLADVRGFIPSHCFEPSAAGAARALGVVALANAAAAVLAVWSYSAGHLWLLPISWLVSGTAFNSTFAVAHDCAHGSFFASERLNSVVGHLTFLTIGYPYYAWRHAHEAHHAYTNRLGHTPDYETVYYDAAWVPLVVDEYREAARSNPSFARIYRWLRAVPPLGSFFHLVMNHFNVARFKPRHRPEVIFSIRVLAAGGLVFAGALWALAGSPLAILHFWILPALCFHLWMSMYTYLQHTAEDIPVFEPEEWTADAGQLQGTTNIEFPRWLSWLHLHPNLHVPHHISTRIPAYWLCEANDALMSSPCAGQLRSVPFSLGYLVRQVTRCKLWDQRARRHVDTTEVDQSVAAEAALE